MWVNWSNAEWTNLRQVLTPQHRIRTRVVLVESEALATDSLVTNASSSLHCILPSTRSIHSNTVYMLIHKKMTFSPTNVDIPKQCTTEIPLDNWSLSAWQIHRHWTIGRSLRGSARTTWGICPSVVTLCVLTTGPNAGKSMTLPQAWPVSYQLIIIKWTQWTLARKK